MQLACACIWAQVLYLEVVGDWAGAGQDAFPLGLDRVPRPGPRAGSDLVGVPGPCT